MDKKEYLLAVMRKLEKRGLSGDELKKEMDEAEANYKEEVSPMQAVLDKDKRIVELETEVHNLKDENRTLREEMGSVKKPEEGFITTGPVSSVFCTQCTSKGVKHLKICPTKQ